MAATRVSPPPSIRPGAGAASPPVDVEGSWALLCKLGGAAAIAVVLLMPIQMFVFINWPPPEDALGWFTLFQDRPLVALVGMDLLLIVDYVLLGIVFLALWPVLRRTNESLMTLALTFQLISVATYLASTTAFEMLSLSQRYAAAASEAERGGLLAVGEGMLATWQGTAFDVSYVLSALAFLIVSALMLRSSFGRTTAYVGLFGGFFMLLPPTVGTVGVIASLVSLIPLYFWLIAVGRRLVQIAVAAEAKT